MRLSKLQRRILALALVEYEKPREETPEWMTERGIPAGEAPRSRALTSVRGIVTMIYGIEEWSGWRGIKGGKQYKARHFSPRYNNHGWTQAWWEPSPPAMRKRVAAASAAIQRALRTLRARGYFDASTWAYRLSEAGVAAARDAKRVAAANPPIGAFVTESIDSVTRCACGQPLDAQRSTRRYCSPACRQTAYRLRTAVQP